MAACYDWKVWGPGMLMADNNEDLDVAENSRELRGIRGVREGTPSAAVLGEVGRCNNAGVMATPYTLTGDGIELQFQTNHLSHFLLTNLLLDSLKETAKKSGTEGRIVILASSLHQEPYPEGIRFDRINDEKGYVPFLAYGQSKLANVLHARELSRKLQAEGANVTVNAVHPGIIHTNLTRSAAPWWIAPIALPIVFFKYKLLGTLKDVPQGAATTVYVATSPEVAGVTGKYFADCQVNDGSAKSQDPTLASALWDLSVKMTSA